MSLKTALEIAYSKALIVLFPHTNIGWLNLPPAYNQWCKPVTPKRIQGARQ